MHFNLRMLNLWIGLCRGIGGLPSTFRDLGFEDKHIEFSFRNEDNHEVCPELIICSDSLRCTLVFEWKSGNNTDGAQLNRYTRISRRILIERAFLTPAAAETHDIVIIGLDSSGDRLKIGLRNGNHTFPLVLVDNQGMLLGLNAFHHSEINQLFSPRFAINWTTVPTGYVRIDAESPLNEVGEVVIPRILQYMRERRPRAQIDDICNDTCIAWGMMGAPAKGALRSKVVDVIEKAQSFHFTKYLRLASNKRSIDIIGNPLDIRADKRTAAYKLLRTRQAEFLAYLTPNRTSDGHEQQVLPNF